MSALAEELAQLGTHRVGVQNLFKHSENVIGRKEQRLSEIEEKHQMLTDELVQIQDSMQLILPECPQETSSFATFNEVLHSFETYTQQLLHRYLGSRGSSQSLLLSPKEAISTTNLKRYCDNLRSMFKILMH